MRSPIRGRQKSHRHGDGVPVVGVALEAAQSHSEKVSAANGKKTFMFKRIQSKQRLV